MKELPSLAGAPWLCEKGLQKLFAVIAAAGGEARVAGGAVRNALLGVAVSDVDVAVTLPPEKVMEICRAAGLGVHPTGIAHGTVTVVAGKRTYEVTTLRRDVTTDGRRAEVAFHDSWREDALRRDFTVNALYCDAKGKIYDFTDGYSDILRKRINFVGVPAKRIAEDYLRILRFFRFHACFGRGAPDKAGLAACTRARKGLDTLSPERLRQELLKLLPAPGAVPTLKVMAEAGILSHVLAFNEDWRVLKRLPPDPLLRLAALAAEPALLKDRLRLSNDEALRIATALGVFPPSPRLRPAEQRRVLFGIGPEAWRDGVQLAWARSRDSLSDRQWARLLSLPERWPVPTLPVTGSDLLAAGVKHGPEIGLMLQKLEDWWAAGDFKASRAALLARVDVAQPIKGRN